MRFIHTADWQLGKPYGRFEAELRAALSEARFDAIDAIGKAAEQHGAEDVLVAGDVFDTHSPVDRTIIQALSRMKRYGCRWWLLAGNHDYARNGGLWDRVRGKLPGNVTVVDEAEPKQLEPGVWLLPAPLSYRHTLTDPTDVFEKMQTPGAKLRIGLAHGSVRDFGHQGETRNQIAPDRAQISKLDYLALGDWHGTIKLNTRTWYSGTPEADQFLRDEPGQALLVDLEEGVEPQVTVLRTGRYQWLVRTWNVNDETAFSSEWNALLRLIEPAATLVQLKVSGIVALQERIGVIERLEHDLRHQLRFLFSDTEQLVGQPSEEDIAELSIEGALGLAAGKLREKAMQNDGDSVKASRALERLFVEYQRGQTA